MTFSMKWHILPIGLLVFMMVFQNHLFAKEEARSRHVYTVIIPDSVPLNNLKIEYFLMDDSGGGSDGIVKHTGTDHRFIISTDENGKDAVGLDVVVFCPGYQTVTIFEPSLATSKRESALKMEKLPMIHIYGQIADYKPLAARDLVVRVTFNGMVGLPHWNSLDDRIQTFKIATVPLLANGSFSMEIPDFTHDKSSPSGHMTISVQTKDARELLLYLSPNPKGPNSHFGWFEIQQTYDPIVTFYGYKWAPPK